MVYQTLFPEFVYEIFLVTEASLSVISENHCVSQWHIFGEVSISLYTDCYRCSLAYEILPFLQGLSKRWLQGTFLYHALLLFYKMWSFNMFSYLCSLVAEMVENPPAIRETWIRSLGWEDPLEEGMATHSSVFSPRESHRQRSLVGYSPWDGKESDTTERLSTQHTPMLTLSLALAGLDRILSINLIFFFTTFPLFCLLERVLLCPLTVSPFSALGGKDLSLSDWFSPGFWDT